MDPEIRDKSEEIRSNYPKLDTYRSISKLDEAPERNQGPKSLVLPHIHGNCHGFMAHWWTHMSIFDAWLPDCSFAYKYCKFGPETRLERAVGLSFLLFSVV